MNYIGNKLTQNFVCLQPQKSLLLLFLKLDPVSVNLERGFTRDLRGIGHFCTALSR